MPEGLACGRIINFNDWPAKVEHVPTGAEPLVVRSLGKDDLLQQGVEALMSLGLSVEARVRIARCAGMLELLDEAA